MSGAASVGMHKRGKTLHLEVSKDQSYSPQDPPHPPRRLPNESRAREEGREARTAKGKKRGWHLVPPLKRDDSYMGDIRGGGLRITVTSSLGGRQRQGQVN